MAKDLDIKSHDLVYCFYCSEWFQIGDGWDAHCQLELERMPSKRCGAVTYRNTIILPAFCLFCRQSEDRLPSERLRYWERDADAIQHILDTHKLPADCLQCGIQSISLEHLHDFHGYYASSGRVSSKTTALGDETESSVLQTVPPSATKILGGESWYGGDVDMVSGPETPDWLCGEPTLWPSSHLLPDAYNAADFNILPMAGPQELERPELCLPPQLLQWSTCANGATLEQGAKRTPLPSSPRLSTPKLKRGSSSNLSPPSLAPTSPLTLADPPWFNQVRVGDGENGLSCSQATIFSGNNGTREQGPKKPTTRIKIVGRWANRSKEKMQGKSREPHLRAEADLRGSSAASPAPDAFMEEYFRFPSPSSSSGNGAPDVGTPTPQLGLLPGADASSHPNPSDAADLYADATACSSGAGALSGGGGALTDDNPARRQVRIKVTRKIGRRSEETDERPRKQIKTARCCGVCGMHGHNARTCQEAAESSEPAVSEVIVVRL